MLLSEEIPIDELQEKSLSHYKSQGHLPKITNRVSNIILTKYRRQKNLDFINIR